METLSIAMAMESAAMISLTVSLLQGNTPGTSKCGHLPPLPQPSPLRPRRPVARGNAPPGAGAHVSAKYSAVVRCTVFSRVVQTAELHTG